MNDVPPANRVQSWFRAILWTVPMVILIASWLGLGWLAHRVEWLVGIEGRMAVAVSIVMTFGVGVGEYLLRPPSKSGADEGRTVEILFQALVFLMIQFLCLIPVLLGLVFMIWYLLVVQWVR